MATLILTTILLLLYILPIITAVMRHSPHSLAITILTVLLGWTGAGWAVALAWAMNWGDITNV